jgi:predicted KAP-like P-loop ATPase
MKKHILIELDEEFKKEFFSICKEFGVKPMGILVVFILMFTNNNLNRKKILSCYKEYKDTINSKKTEILLENRIDGNLAHRLNKVRK